MGVRNLRRHAHFSVVKALLHLSNGAWLEFIGEPSGMVPTAESCPFSSRAKRTAVSNGRMNRQTWGVVSRASVIPSQ